MLKVFKKLIKSNSKYYKKYVLIYRTSIYEDYDFVLSVFTSCKSISAVNDPFYSYRQGRANSITGSSSIKMIYGIEYTVNKWLKETEKIGSEMIRKDVLNYLAFI